MSSEPGEEATEVEAPLGYPGALAVGLAPPRLRWARVGSRLTDRFLGRHGTADLVVGMARSFTPPEYLSG